MTIAIIKHKRENVPELESGVTPTNPSFAINKDATPTSSIEIQGSDNGNFSMALDAFGCYRDYSIAQKNCR
jgi:hypothetical protein